MRVYKIAVSEKTINNGIELENFNVREVIKAHHENAEDIISDIRQHYIGQQYVTGVYVQEGDYQDWTDYSNGLEIKWKE